MQKFNNPVNHILLKENNLNCIQLGIKIRLLIFCVCKNLIIL